MKAILAALVVLGVLQNALSVPDCNESEIIEGCQNEQKRLYEEGNADLTKQLYCSNSQALMDCLVRDSECKGDKINKYRYTNLEYNVMNLRTDLCPSLQTESLAELIPKDLKYEHKYVDDLGGDKGSACATGIHWKCVQGLLPNLHDPDVTLCDAVKTFMNCYEEAMKEACKSPLLEHFHHILTHLNQEVFINAGC